jgi:UDP-N-acetylmuramate: L-alanyl-gamma-D-glutamyl-meso-diaminopimelate ligase
LSAIQAALASFLSVKRRLEVRAVIDGVTIIDDFAHHPTAIRETLRALRQVYPNARLWAVLEPRSNTLRRNVFQQELVESLALADRVILDSVYQQQRIPEGERLHPEQVIAALNAAGTPAELCADVAAIVDRWSGSCSLAMWWQSSPMADSTAFTRSFRRGLNKR